MTRRDDRKEVAMVEALGGDCQAQAAFGALIGLCPPSTPSRVIDAIFIRPMNRTPPALALQSFSLLCPLLTTPDSPRIRPAPRDCRSRSMRPMIGVSAPLRRPLRCASFPTSHMPEGLEGANGSFGHDINQLTRCNIICGYNEPPLYWPVFPFAISRAKGLQGPCRLLRGTAPKADSSRQCPDNLGAIFSQHHLTPGV